MSVNMSNICGYVQLHGSVPPDLCAVVFCLQLNGLNVFWFGLILKKASETLRGKNSFDKRD